MSSVAPRGHNPWLDLLRATAIVLVLMRHGAREIGVEGAPVSFRSLMLNGWVGVDLFFVLSGFLITRQLLREIGASGTLDLPRFLLRRGLRIIPAYVAVLALVVLGAFPLYAVNPDNLGLRTVYHLVFLQDYLPADINVVYWSLGVEEKFYLAAPLLVFAIAGAAGARHRAWLLLGGLFLLAPTLRAVTFAGLPQPLDYETFFRSLRSPFHASLEPLVLGVAIAVAEAHLPRSARIGGLLLGLGAALLLAWLVSHEALAEIRGFDAILQPSLIALICGSMATGAVMLGGTPLPGATPVRALAVLSFALYLVHFPLLPLARALTTPAHVAAFWATYLALSLAAALAVHLCVERPVLRWRDRQDARQPDAAGVGLSGPQA